MFQMKYADKYPLSFAQRRMWLVSQIDSSNPSYNIVSAIRLIGDLDGQALQDAFQAVIDRHDSLRTSFGTENNEPYQEVHVNVKYKIPVIDLAHMKEDERDVEIRRIIQEKARAPFNLNSCPLMRTVLMRCGKGESVFLLILHHIISDERSLGILWNEMSRRYNALLAKENIPLGPVKAQHRDYVEWQKEKLEEEIFRTQEEYWMNIFEKEASNLDIITDRPRAGNRTYIGETSTLSIDPEIGRALKSLSKRYRVTLFMTVLAAFYFLLKRYSGQDDIIVGAPFAGRRGSRFSDVIGFFLNTLALRVDLSGNPTFIELLGRVRETVLGAYKNQDYPFDKLVEKINPVRGAGRNPLFQVMFIVLNREIDKLELNGLKVEEYENYERMAMFDLTLYFFEAGDGLELIMEYNVDLFDEKTVERMMKHLNVALGNIVKRPEARLSELRIMGDEERKTALETFNAPAAGKQTSGFVQLLFEDQAKQTPDRTAVILDDTHITYCALDEKARKLASYLVDAGVGAEIVVGVLMERSIDMIVAVIGVLRAGGAYVPLDASYPRERIGYIVRDAGIDTVVTQDGLKDLCAGLVSDIVCMDSGWNDIETKYERDTEIFMNAQGLAYVIYTSGSTGRPKGVMIEHGGLCNLVESQKRGFGIGDDSRVLQFASLSFDASVSEIFTALTGGAALVLGTHDALQPGRPLVNTLLGYAVTTVTLPPSVLASLPRTDLPPLQTLVIAGEAVTGDVAGRWMSTGSVINAYGPTEATVCSTFERITLPAGNPSVGYPIDGVKIHLLDEHVEPVPVGVPAELNIGGVGLARGYLNSPGMTAEKFIPDAFADGEGNRLYMSGDIARYRIDGAIEFLGRRDRQIKVRGFRIEPGEIEAILCTNDRLAGAVVTARTDAHGDTRLIGYLVVEEGSAPRIGEIRAFLRKRLPDYMIPNLFVYVESLPLTPAGKIDMRALPEPEAVGPGSREGYESPRNPIEEVLAGIWSAILNVEQVGVRDDFFELGGHSLLAVRISARIRTIFNVEIHLDDFFGEPTVSNLARLVTERAAEFRDRGIRKIGRVDRGDADIVLSKLHQLSDDEVDRMLREMSADEETSG